MIVSELLDELDRSGLLGEAEVVQLGYVGDPGLEQHFPDSRAHFRYWGELKQYEFPTLVLLQEYARANPDARILYLNGLGVSQVGRSYLAHAHWRALLNYLLIEKYRDCISLLDRHDVCSCEWLERPMPHYSSNNWWANASFIASLCSPREAIARVQQQDFTSFGSYWMKEQTQKRHAAEFWLGMSSHVSAKSLFTAADAGHERSMFGGLAWFSTCDVEWVDLVRPSTTKTWLLDAFGWRRLRMSCKLLAADAEETWKRRFGR